MKIFNKEALKITIIFVVIGLVWIIFDDNLFQRFINVKDEAIIHNSYESIFLLVSSFIIYWFVYKGIVKQRSYEEKLRESEIKYKALFLSAGDAAFVFQDNKILDCNERAVKMLEGSKEEILGLTPLDISPRVQPDGTVSKDFILSKINDILKGKAHIHQFEWQHKTLNNVLIDVEIYINVVDAKKNIFIATWRDITDRKKAEAKIINERNRTLNVIDGTHAGIWDWNIQDDELIINERWADIIGFTIEDLKPIDFNMWKNTVHPDDILSVSKILEKVLNNESEYYDTEFRQKHKNGSWVWVNARAKVIEWTNDGKPMQMSGTHLDITDRKKSEEKLIESEEKHRTLYTNTPVMLHSIDQEGRLISVSNQWLKVMGYKSNEVIGNKSTEYLTEKSKEYAKNEVLPVFFKNGFINEIPYQFVKKNGEIIDVLLSAISEKDNKGNIIRSLAVIIDVTERKKSEEKLKESEEKYRTLLENMNDIVMLVDNDDKVLYVNSRFTEKLGYTEDEIIGEIGYEKLLAPEDHELIKKANIDRTKDVINQYEAEFISKSGKKIDLLVSGAPIKNSKGEIIGSIGNLTDITERKKVEKALKESEEKFKTIIDSAPMGIAQLDMEGHPINCNRALVNFVGYSEDELKRMVFTEFTHPDDANIDMTLYLEMLEGKRQSYSLEKRYFHKNGSLIWGHLNVTIIRNDHGKPEFIVGMVVDITEKKHSQQKVLHAMMNAEERERSRIAKDLHDGVSPILSAVKLYLRALLIAKDEKTKNETSEKIIQTINEAIQSTSDISNKLSPHILQNFGLATAVETFIEKISETTQLQFSFFSDIEYKLSENIEVNLYRVTIEFINNTVKYANAKNITISLTEKENIIKMHFEHNGKGFNLEEVRKESKGMGLHNLFARISSLNGKIDIDTKINAGVKVDITLPLD